MDVRVVEKASIPVVDYEPSCLPQTKTALRDHPRIADLVQKAAGRTHDTSVDALVFCLAPDLREPMSDFYRSRRRQLRNIASPEALARLDARLASFVFEVAGLRDEEVMELLLRAVAQKE